MSALSPLVQGLARNWRCPWIWPKDATESRNAYALFRLSFESPDATDLTLHLTADSWYCLYLDGEFIQRGPVHAFQSFYSYDTVTLPIPLGRHLIGILAHHVGEVCATYKKGRPGLRVNGELGGRPLQDCASWRCRSASSWRHDLPEVMSHFGFWEDRDLTLPEAAWARPDFDDSDWAAPEPVADAADTWPILAARDIPPFRYGRVDATPHAQGIWEGDSQAPIPSRRYTERLRQAIPQAAGSLAHTPRHFHTWDFGRTVTGYPRLRIRCAEAATELIVAYDEFVQPCGAVDAERSYVRFADRFLLPAGETVVELVQPRGFRYLTIDLAGPASIDEVWIQEERYPYDDDARSAFRSSCESLDRMYTTDLLTADLCTLDTFVDCPNRERVHFMEAVHPAARSAFLGFGDTDIVRRSLLLGAQSQLPNGAINGFSPSDRTNLAFATSSLLWLHTLIDYWQHTGDEQLMARLAPTLDRLLDTFIAHSDADGLLSGWAAWWDWSPCEMNGTLLVSNAFWLIARERLAAIPALAPSLARLPGSTESLRQRCHERFWNPERQLYRTAIREDGTPSPLANQFGNAMAVLAGICPPEQRHRLLQRLSRPGDLYLQPVGECNNSIGILLPSAERKIIPFGMHYPASFLVEALFQNGLDAEAHQLMHQYWGPCLDQPTFPEVMLPGGNSFLCHDWGCGAAYLLQAYVAGLRPATAGWTEILWAPQPGPLTECRTELRTPRGMIAVQYRREGDSLHLQATFPAGSRLHVRAGENAWTIDETTSWEGTAHAPFLVAR